VVVHALDSYPRSSVAIDSSNTTMLHQSPGAQEAHEQLPTAPRGRDETLAATGDPAQP
jgi:hypothetical protein